MAVYTLSSHLSLSASIASAGEGICDGSMAVLRPMGWVCYLGVCGERRGEGEMPLRVCPALWAGRYAGCAYIVRGGRRWVGATRARVKPKA